MNKHSGQIVETGWASAKKTPAYLENFDKIKWDKTGGMAKKGKAKASTSTRLLEVQETVDAVRTPIGLRDDKTFRHIS